MTRKLNIVVKRPKKSAEIVEIENGLEILQCIVEGHIEWVSTKIFEYPMGIYCNEEGFINNLPQNIWLPDQDIVLRGTIIVLQCDQFGNEISLTPTQAERAVLLLNALEVGNEVEAEDDGGR